ncbi:MAG: ribose 5-phosphate isomerase B [Spirochaetota bacterium]
MKKIIAIGSDHAGFLLKNEIIDYLKSKNLEVIDCGTYSTESCDYPDYAKLVAEKVSAKEADAGILLCGTGIGVSIAANKVKGVRAALVWNSETAALSKQHNDANIICIGARFIASFYAKKIIDAYLNAEFEKGNHQRRVEKISKIESN